MKKRKQSRQQKWWLKITGGLIGIFLCMSSCLMFTGCEKQDESVKKLRDMEFCVLARDEIPEELLLRIEKEKEKEIKMTLQYKDYLYIVRGYGKQDTSGYHIQVKDLYLSPEYVVVDTELIGPKEGEKIEELPTFPYVVIKTEFMERDVLFL